MAKPLTPEQLDLELKMRAYGQGFATGANLLKSARHTVDSDTHEHWRQGYEDGRVAAEKYAEAYRKRLHAKAAKTV